VVAAFFAGAAPESRRLAFLLAQAASAVLLFALAWRILCIEGHVPARDVGLTLRDAGREAGLGLAACLAYLPLYALVVLAQSWALTRAGAPLPEQQAVRLLRDGGDLRVVAVLAAQAILLAPAVEELVFRALLMPALERWMRPGFAAAASSAAFSACHSDAVVVTPIFVLGCVLGYVYLRRRSLVTAVACHAAHNALFVVAILMTRFATGPRP
jgi:membrane protease YdiL (CAAX protease family)